LLTPYYIDTRPAVEACVKNAELGFAIPYLYNVQPHDYVPDFLYNSRSSLGYICSWKPKAMTPWPRSKPRLQEEATAVVEIA